MCSWWWSDVFVMGVGVVGCARDGGPKTKHKTKQNKTQNTKQKQNTTQTKTNAKSKTQSKKQSARQNYWWGGGISVPAGPGRPPRTPAKNQQ